MNEHVTLETFGELVDPATLKIERLLPGPIERVWSYLTDSDLRRQWLAAGSMQAKVGSSVELVWRNDELSDPPGKRPAGTSGEHRLESRITAFDPPRKLGLTWGTNGEVSFDLQPKGNKVLLTLIHRRVPNRDVLLNVSAGWHMHLDTLTARLTGEKTMPFWEGWNRLKADYERRMPA